MLAIPLHSYTRSYPPELAADPSVPQAFRAISPAQAFPSDAMISVMPTPRPLTPKRPKLSLQTSTLSTLPVNNRSRTTLSQPSSAVNPPSVFRNTNDNDLEAPPPTPVSANPHMDEAFTQLRQPERPSPHTASSFSSSSTSSSGPSSPFANTAPYTLGMGARSILRNSPLPRRHVVNLANRPAKRMFQPIKRVSFPEQMIEMIPTPVPTDLDVDDIENDEVESIVNVDKAISPSQPPIKQFTGIPGRRKRRGRDWVWRPTDDESSPTQVDGLMPSPLAAESAEDDLTMRPTLLVSASVSANDVCQSPSHLKP